MNRWLHRVWMGLCYLLGIALWGIFLNWGNIPFGFLDWAEINAPRLAFVRDAVLKGVLPLHMNGAHALRGITDRFLSIPDPIISPQVLLMKFMDVGTFILVDTLLLYTLGFLGLCWLKRRYALSLPVFTALFVLFNFNGHVVSHYAAGHITWGGYFLFPWYIGLVFCLLEGDRSWAWAAKMASLLFLIYLQGAFHQFIWGMMFLGLLGLASWKNLGAVIKAGLFAGLLSAVRLLPPSLLLGQFDSDFLGGYPLARNLLDAMLFERLPQNAAAFQNFYSNLGYWEFDLYLGFAGTFLVGMGVLLWGILALRDVDGVKLKKLFPVCKTSNDPSSKPGFFTKLARIFSWLPPSRPGESGFLPLLFPMLVITFFSIGSRYKLLADLPIPLLNGERVSSRMVILPVLFAVTLACIAVDHLLKNWELPLVAQGAGAVFLVYMGYDLSKQVIRWRVTEMFAASPEVPFRLENSWAANHPDPQYFALLWAGLGITLISALILVWLVRREAKGQKSQK